MGIGAVSNVGSSIPVQPAMPVQQPAVEVQPIASDGIEIQEIQQEPVKQAEHAAPQNEQPHEKSEQEVEAENERIKKAISNLNKKLDHNTEAVFGVHEKTNRVTIKMVDKESKKVVKEFPPDKTLDMIAKVWELAGLMVDEKG
ncbi:MAG: flagellar protein FlaG [Lachnospiraceae bacterium]|nr:flagellar protein FlaG [Lachnospiraceae bacterium]